VSAIDPSASTLGPEQRAADVARTSTQSFDLVIVGAGVTGAGAALDASSRGLSVALVDSHDIAYGTSSRSGKTLHGGLRYLEQLNFSLVREAAHERNLLVSTVAPYLANPTPFLIPLAIPFASRAFYGAGVTLYDALGGLHPAVPRHRHFSKTATTRLAPSLSQDHLVGGIRYYDAIVDDARLTMLLARTARSLGATVITGARVTSLQRAGGRVSGVECVDRETGESFAIAARVVINATGVWSEEVQELGAASRVRVRPAKGVHAVIPGDRIDAKTGILARAGDSVVVARPWADGRFWIIGTTDTPYAGDRENPVASDEDIDYLLDAVNQWIAPGLTPEDVVGRYAGLRPLVTGSAKSTAKLSRDHAVMDGPPGLVSIVGGKYTTYRVMAADVVDRAARQLDESVPPSRTGALPLLGVDPTAGSSPDRAGLAGRYGTLVGEISSLIANDAVLGTPLPGGDGVLKAEILYAAAAEGARTLQDALARRTHIAIQTRDHGKEAAGPAADLLGGVLGWNSARRKAEIGNYLSWIAAENGESK
jgi:glycerol-3-phosphate dehydrogenase